MPKRGRPSFAALAAAEAASAAAVSAATPSKKLKGSAAGQTVTDAAASAQLAEQVQDDSSSINFGLVQQVHDALGVINGNPVFTNIIEQLPLTHDEGGSQVPFCQESLSTALSGDGEGRVYLCGGNYFWQNFTWIVNHRMPVNPGTIKELQSFSLKPMKPPRHFPFTTIFGVDTPTEVVSATKGALQRISPPEPAFAVLFSIRDAITAGASLATLMEWRRAILSAPFQFEVCPKGEDQGFNNIPPRDQIPERTPASSLNSPSASFTEPIRQAFGEVLRSSLNWRLLFVSSVPRISISALPSSPRFSELFCELLAALGTPPISELCRSGRN